MKNKLTFACLILAAIAIMFAVTGCKKIKVYRQIAPEFVPYVASFEQNMRTYRREYDAGNMIMRFATLNNQWVGECIGSYGGQKQVLIDIEYWNWLDEGQKVQLIWHELGHCWLLQDHRDAALADGSPASVMNTVAFWSGIFETHELYYINELFKH